MKLRKIFKTVATTFVFTIATINTTYAYKYENQNDRIPDILTHVGIGIEDAKTENAEKFYSLDTDYVEIGYYNSDAWHRETELFGDDLYVSSNHNYYVDTGKTYTTYNEAKTVAENTFSSGTGIVLVIDNGLYTVYGRCENNYEDSLNLAKTVNATVIETNSVIELKSNQQILLASDISNYSMVVKYANNNSSTTHMDTFKIGEKYFSGALAFAKNSDENIIPVNVVPITDYLYSVVPSEIPASWHLEALKAQAMSAKNYTMYRTMEKPHDGYELCNTVHCQVYNGVGEHNDRTSTAVDDTKDIYLCYEDILINAMYCSSSGGHTENSEDVYSGVLGYLRAVPEIAEYNASEWQRSFTLSEITSLVYKQGENVGDVEKVAITNAYNNRAQELFIYGSGGEISIEGDAIRTFFAPSSEGSLKSKYFVIGETLETPDYSENEKLNIEGGIGYDNSSYESIDFDIKLEQNTKNIYIATSLVDSLSVYNGGIDFTSEIFVMGKNLNRINLGNRNFVGTNGYETVEIDGVLASEDEFSNAIASNFNSGVVDNSVYDVATNENYLDNISESTGDIVTFTGRGWGHGVGMSQYGAYGMAQEGYDFTQILKHYYTDVDILHSSSVYQGK